MNEMLMACCSDYSSIKYLDNTKEPVSYQVDLMMIYPTSLLLSSCLIGNCIYKMNKWRIHLVLYGLLLHTLNSVVHKNLPGSFPHQLLIPLLWHDKLHGSFISWNILGITKKLNALFTNSVKTRWGLKCIPSIVNHLNKSAFTTPRKPLLR